MPHFVVFGEIFDFGNRAHHRFPGGEVTLVIEKQRRKETSEDNEIDHVIEVSEAQSDLGTIVETIDQWSKPTHVVALVDHLMPLAARYASRMGLAFHSETTVHDIVDKSAMRQRLKNVPELAIRAETAYNERSFSDAVRNVGLPLVVKPTNSTGSQGVTVLRRGDDPSAAWKRARTISGHCIVEEYLEGPQYSVEAFSENRRHVVLAITRKFSDQETLVEMGHVLPAALTENQRADFVHRTTQLLDRVGLSYGPSHTEFVLTGRGPLPIETHARVGGDDIYLMVKDATQVDMDALQVNQVFGDSVASLLVPREGPAQAIWFGATETGTNISAHADTDMSEETPITWLRSGDIPSLKSSADRAFQVRSSGVYSGEALERARSMAARLSLENGLTERFSCLESMI